ncbi:VCBS repeat-containing/serralysin-like metalloprotease domain-containing protein [Rhizobium etli bv. phaseoli str. IE4803]|nr:VCBS repeat-containing/serralysin-like metalloprotease domain-containing protein [Rhizobium etli bv. phaseoli str. IE4803]
MATTTVSGTTVTFSNSGAAANLTQSGTEDGSLQFTFDVLAASGGGVKTTIYSVDDGVKNDDGGAAIIVTNKAFVDYNKDLLMQDGVGISFSQTSQMGATFWIGSDNKIHYDAAGLSAQINALDAGETFTDTIQYTIKMSNGTLSVGTLTVVINGINDAPVLSGNPATLAAGAEDTPYTISTADLLAGFSDAEGDQMSVTGLTANHGALVDNNDGTWTFTPDANYNGPVSLSYSVTDGNGGSVPATQSFTLDVVNDAPVLSGNAATLSAGTEDTPYTFSTADLLAGFTDVDGDQLSVAGLTADHGALIDNNDGTWTFTPAENYNGPVSLSYSVTDGNGGSVAASQSFTLDAVNDAPVLSGNAATLAAGTEDTAYTFSTADLLAGFTDVDGDLLSVSGLTADHGALVDNNDGTWTFTPAANYNGPVSFSYTVTDGNGGSVPASQSFTLDAVNDAPVLSGNAATLAAGSEDTAYTFSSADLLAGFTDVEGDQLSVAGLTADHGALIDNNDGSWTFTPDANYNGPVSLSYSVTDGQGGSVPATQSFTLDVVNDAPVLSGNAATLVAGTEDTPYTFSTADLLAGFTDVDGDQLSVAGLTADHGALIDNNDGTWTFTPAENYNGPVSLSYSVTDGNGGSVPATQSFTLDAVNDAPVLSGNAATLAAGSEDTAYTFSSADLLAGFTDVDADQLSVAGLTADHGALIDNNDGTWTFTPDANYNGPVSLSYSVSDGNGGSVPASQSFTLDAVNDAPVLSGNAATLAAGTEDTAYTFSTADLLAGFTDVDGDLLSVSGLTADHGALVDNNDGTWTFTPAANYNGPVSFSYTVTDGNGGSVPASQSFTLDAVNDAPVLSGNAATLAAGSEDTAYTFSSADLLAGFTDVEGDQLSVAGLTADHGALIDNNDGSWTFTPDANYNGPVSLSYTVTDGQGGSVPASQSFTLDAVNDAPVLSGNAATLVAGTEDTPYTFSTADLLAGFTDVDGDQLSVAGLTADHGALIDNNDGTWSFTPAENYNGPVSLSYSVTDGNGGSVAASQSFTLDAVNDAPVLSGNAATMAAGSEDTAYTFSTADLLAGFTDVDADQLSVAGLTANHGALVDNNDGSWTFTPDANYNGPVSLSYSVSDGNGGSVPATQSFTLDAVNDAPVLSGNAATLAAGTEDTAYTFSSADLLAGFTDVDGDQLSVAGLTADHGALVDNNDGSWTFTPDANYNGPVSLSYTVIDGNGGTVPASQSFTLDAVNDAPVLSGNAATLAAGTEDTPYTFSTADLLTGFSDVDGDQLSVSGLTANHGALVDNNDGTWTFTPDANYNGPVSLSYTVTDGNGGNVPATQSFTLDAVNDAPTAVVLSNTVTSAPENGGVIKIADIAVTDVDSGNNVLSLSGSDAASFTILNGALYFNGGADFEAKAGYDVTVDVNDPTVGGTPDASHNFHLDITDVMESDSDTSNDHDTDTATATTTNWGETNGVDTKVGNAGDNTISGGNSGDILYGQAGNDTLNGNNGADKLYGQAGNDILIGSQGLDTLYGGSGNDTLSGSGEQDELWGGSGNDTFVFTSVGDSTSVSPDTIRDFHHGFDKIDVSGLDAYTVNPSIPGDQAFAWGGTTVTAHGAWYTESGGNTILHFDTNGDANTDETTIVLTGTNLGLTDSDFLL